MVKKIVFLLFIVSTFMLASCSFGTGKKLVYNDDKRAAAKLEQVIKAIKNKDKESLKSMFSKQAIDDADDFDGSMNDFFDFFQGKIDSWEKLDGPTVFESNDYGHIKKELKSYYYVKTDKQKYFFLLRDYPVDTDHPDNVGLYMLLVVKAEDEEKIYDGDKKILYDGNKKIPHAGIYIPIK